MLKSYQNGERIFTGDGGNIVGGIYSDLNNRRKFENICKTATNVKGESSDRIRATSCKDKEKLDDGDKEYSYYDGEYSEFEHLAEDNNYQVIDKDCNFILDRKKNKIPAGFDEDHDEVKFQKIIEELNAKKEAGFLGNAKIEDLVKCDVENFGSRETMQVLNTLRNDLVEYEELPEGVERQSVSVVDSEDGDKVKLAQAHTLVQTSNPKSPLKSRISSTLVFNNQRKSPRALTIGPSG